jgi:putative acetyltransferase
MKIRRFTAGDEAALFRVCFSATHEIASRDYSQGQIDAWAPVSLDQELWATRLQDIRPFIVGLHGDVTRNFA